VERECIVHEQFTRAEIDRIAMEHPDAELIAHRNVKTIILVKQNSSDRQAHYEVRSKFIAQQVYCWTELVSFIKWKSQWEDIPSLPAEENCACNDAAHESAIRLEKLYLVIENMNRRLNELYTATRATNQLKRCLQ